MFSKKAPSFAMKGLGMVEKIGERMLKIDNIYKKFNLDAGLFAKYGKFVYAVNGVSLSVGNNEIYGLVGESGCGKTTVAKLIVRIYNIDSGNIIYEDKIGNKFDAYCDKKDLRKLRNKVRYIFQDPARSLNPKMKVIDILLNGYKYSKKGDKNGLARATEVIKNVGLSESDFERRPNDFSGGQRQRISIARSLITNPEFLICDEVVSALDVSIQSQILNLLLEIKQKENISMLFIAHDLTVVSYFCDKIGVMYAGYIVEEGTSKDIIENRKHPYTNLLYESIPHITGSDFLSNVKKSDEVPNLTIKPKGCLFYARCPSKMDICKEEAPKLKQIDSNNNTHKVACYLNN